MKKIGLILLWVLAVPLLGWTQTENKAVVNSQGGGAATGGNYVNFAVVGQQVQSVTVGKGMPDNNPAVETALSIGFLYAVESVVPVIPCLPPLGTTVSDLTDISVTIGWSAEAGKTYDYRLRASGSAEYIVDLENQAVAQADFTALTPGTTYFFEIRTRCDAEDLSEWSQELVFETLTCDVPDQVAAVVSDQQVTVTWTPVSTNPIGYYIFYSLVGEETMTEIFVEGGGSNEYTLTDLPSGDYMLFVGAVCENVSEVAMSDVVPFTIEFICVAPSNITVSGENATFLVSWSEVPNALEYQVRTRRVGTSEWTTQVYANTDVSASIEGLDDGSYEVQVGAFCEGVPLPTFSTSQVIEVANPCAAPFNITTLVDGADVTVSWTSTEENVTDFTVRYRLIGTEIWTSIAVAKEASSVLFEGLAGGLYQVQVGAECTGVASPLFSEISIFIIENDCDAPTGVSFAITGQDVALSWSLANATPVGYFVRYRLTTATEWITIDTESLETQYLLAGLSSGIYQVQIGVLCEGLASPSYASSVLFEIESTCPVPNQLMATEVTSAAIRVAWQDEADAANYNVRLRLASTFTWQTAENINGNEYNFEGLVSGAAYQIEVQSVCESNQLSSWSQSITVTTESVLVCLTPDNIQVSDISTNTATVQWQAVENAQLYELRYRVSGTSAIVSMQTLNTSVQLSGLQAGSNYVLEIRTVCDIDGVYSEFSTPVTFSTEPGTVICNVPSGVVASVDVTNLSLSWNDLSALAYEVRLKRSSATTWINRQVVGVSTTFSNLVQGVTYDYQVRSLCGTAGEVQSTWSAVQQILIPAAFECVAPTNFTATTGVGDPGEIMVSWTNNEAANYRVRYRVVGFPFWSSLTTSESILLVGLAPGEAYEVTVAAECSADGTILSTFLPIRTVNSSGNSVCSLPTEITATPSVGGVEISWNGSADNYLLRYRPIDTQNWTFVELATNNFQTSLLLEGMRYQFQINSLCSSQLNSGFSIMSEFTTEGAPVCSMPVVNGTATTTNNTIDISWSEGEGALYYNLQYRVEGTITWTTRAVVGDVFSATNLQPGTRYEFRVQAVCDESGQLKSPYSQRVTFSTTGVATCIAPSNLLATTTADQATITWDQMEGIQYAQIRYRKLGDLGWQLVSGVSATEVVLSPLTPATQYEYQVRSVCDANTGQLSSYSTTQSFQTTGDACMAPIVSLENVTETTALFTWTSPEGSALAGEFSYQYRINGSNTWLQANSSLSSLELTGLSPGETYHIQVKSLCGANFNSPYSTPIFFTTDGASLCSIPSDLFTIKNAQSSATLHWQGTASFYDVQYRISGINANWTTVLNIATPERTLNSLELEKVYEWRVRARCESGAITSFSPSATFDTFVDEGNAEGDTGGRLGEETAANASELLEGELASSRDFEITAYPNPFAAWVNVQVYIPEKQDNVTLALFNMAGMRMMDIYDGNLSEGEHEFKVDGSQLGSGVYLIIVQSGDDQRYVHKIVR